MVGSGNVVHNLGAMSWDLGDVGFDWAARFDDDAKAFMLSNPSEALRLDGHRDFRAAVPTPDHFIPLLYLAGLAEVAADEIDILADGYAYGSLSMTCSRLVWPTAATPTSCGANHRRHPAPPDESNIYTATVSVDLAAGHLPGTRSESRPADHVLGWRVTEEKIRHTHRSRRRWPTPMTR